MKKILIIILILELIGVFRVNNLKLKIREGIVYD